MKELNDYQLVHVIAERAKEKEILERDPLKKDEYMPTVNKIKEKRNFVKEAHDEILKEIGEE